MGKKKKKNGDLSIENVVKGKRQKLQFPPQPLPSSSSQLPQTKPKSVSSPLSQLSNPSVKSLKKWKIRKGDVVSASTTIFDGNEPGSFSDSNPDRCYGQVVEVTKKGLARVKWSDPEEEHNCRVKDLRLEVKKATAARVIVLLVEGEQVAYANADEKELPKNFFEALVKTNWRRWVEAVKKELTRWDANNAVSVVDIKDVPKNAKVVPLGELYTIKRDGCFKY